MTDNHREVYIRLIEGQQFINGRYGEVARITPTAGNGAFSMVFAARDSKSGKLVALKFFDPLLSREEYRRRCFERESRILSGLQGQRDILQLVEAETCLDLELVDRTSGMVVPIRLSFFATDLAESNIRDYIYGSNVSTLRSLLYFRAMCRAVQRIHSKGICHRDLKPENFFVSGAALCLGDFGTARVLDGGESALLRDYKGWRGDARYTAPEMFAAMDDHLDLFYCGDIYSLGAVLFEMLTRHNLAGLIFNSKFHLDFQQHFVLIDPTKRREVFDGLIETIARNTRLPDLGDFGAAPRLVDTRLDSLYKGLCNLDYKRRMGDFGLVFTEITRCIDLLRREKQYRKLLEIRQLWQERRKQRKAEAINRLWIG